MNQDGSLKETWDTATIRSGSEVHEDSGALESLVSGGAGFHRCKQLYLTHKLAEDSEDVLNIRSFKTVKI